MVSLNATKSTYICKYFLFSLSQSWLLIFMKIYQKKKTKYFLKNVYISVWQLLFAPLDKK